MIVYFCCEDTRRIALRAQRMLNGIDFLEVVDEDAPTPDERQRELRVHFVNSPAPRGIVKSNVIITGGERITRIYPDHDPIYDGDVLVLHVNQYGDFSTYTLSLIDNDGTGRPLGGLDPILSAVDFSFKVECPTDFDCQSCHRCPPQTKPQPHINYLAKDYESFRGLMLDRLSLLTPRWRERNVADLGIMLVELLAYVGDYLSYQQDAVATEAYLETARRRISVRRLARLVDYRIYDGCNARVWVQVQVSADNITAPIGTSVMTKIYGLPPAAAPVPELLDQAARVFETMEDATLFQAHNQISFYTWLDQDCCLPKGATRATLKGSYPNLAAANGSGKVLIFKEAVDPRTGSPDDADPTRRHAVRLTSVQTTDVTTGQPLVDPLANPPQLITEITWGLEDALPFSFCISATANNGKALSDVSVALGNIILADHGRTYTGENLGTVGPTITRTSVSECDRCKDGPPLVIYPRFAPKLGKSPLTQYGTVLVMDKNLPEYHPFDPTTSAAAAFRWDRRNVLPAIDLNDGQWRSVSDLLEADENAMRFVVEVESDGTASLRFGDGNNGMRAPEDMTFTARYRVGNGADGNIGAGTLGHIGLNVAGILQVQIPMAASGGEDKDEIEEVRQYALVAFRTQERAVTEGDYAQVAQRDPRVRQGKATFRWTGSWRTVFLTIDPEGGPPLTDAMATQTRNRLERFRMAGYDLEIGKPIYVPLDIEMSICVDREYFRSDVEAALLEVFSNRLLDDGRVGVFYPDNFGFGQPVYLGTIYAAAQGVAGVSTVRVTRFQRRETMGTNTPAPSELPMHRLEIARLDNDPDYPERGVLRLVMGGGK